MHNLIYDETWSVEDIVKEAHKLIGKKLGEIDKSGWLEPMYFMRVLWIVKNHNSVEK
jgi:hypothetical protein